MDRKLVDCFHFLLPFSDPEGIDLGLYDEIGKDVARILHRDRACVWVECIERPILRLKSDKYSPSPDIRQAHGPAA